MDPFRVSVEFVTTLFLFTFWFFDLEACRNLSSPTRILHPRPWKAVLSHWIAKEVQHEGENLDTKSWARFYWEQEGAGSGQAAQWILEISRPFSRQLQWLLPNHVLKASGDSQKLMRAELVRVSRLTLLDKSQDRYQGSRTWDGFSTSSPCFGVKWRGSRRPILPDLVHIIPPVVRQGSRWREFLFFFLATFCGFQDLGSLTRVEPRPLQWKQRVLTTGLSGNSESSHP